MLNFGSKLHPVVKFLAFPVIFETTTRALRQEHFLDLHVIVFVKNGRITTSVPIILSINQWSLYHLKKCRMNNQIYISQLSTLCFYKVLFKVKKTDGRFNKTLKLKFIFVLFNSVYPARSSDTVTKYTIYPLSYWWKDYSNGLGFYSATLSYV